MSRQSSSTKKRWGGSARRHESSGAPASHTTRGVVLACLVGLVAGGCSRHSATPVASPEQQAKNGVGRQKASTPGSRTLTGPGKMQLASDRRIPDGWVVVGVRREMESIQGVAQHGVEVASEGGIVTLAGTVSTPLARSLLIERALKVDGVRAIVDRIELGPDDISDLAIAEQLRRRLRYDPITEGQSIRVSVDQGVVRLEGSLLTPGERKLAERAAQGIRGVRAVDNLIVLAATDPQPDDALAEEIAQRLARERDVRGEQLAVRVSGGSVFLTGEVKSAFERREVRDLAWLPGVHAVYDDGVRVVKARDHLRDPQAAAPDDDAITRAVTDAMRLDPRLLGTDIEVTTKDGEVTLEGEVTDPISSVAAERDVQATFGARSVKNDIQVRPGAQVADAVLQQRVGERLGAHPGITPGGIRVFVKDGWVMLSGTAESAYEKNRAEGASSSVKGVVGVVNRLAIQPKTDAPIRDDDAIRADIERALANDARVTPELVEVEVRDGVATVRGRVPTYEVFDAVLENVFEALPREVDNRLEVAEPPGSKSSDLSR